MQGTHVMCPLFVLLTHRHDTRVTHCGVGGPSVVDWPFERIQLVVASVLPCTAVVYNSEYGTKSRNKSEIALLMHTFIVCFIIVR